MNEIPITWSWLESPPGIYVLYLAVGINLVLTLAHSIQELKGYLWRYFGAIAGIRISDSFGFSVFFVGLLILLWPLGFFGIGNPIHGKVPPGWAIAFVAVLIGGRLSDSIFSHIRLHFKKYRPNPGLSSVPFYLIEAVFLTALFLPGLWNYRLCATVGFIVGWSIFFLVLPLLRLARSIFPSLKREQWQSGESKPLWVEAYSE